MADIKIKDPVIDQIKKRERETFVSTQQDILVSEKEVERKAERANMLSDAYKPTPYIVDEFGKARVNPDYVFGEITPTNYQHGIIEIAHLEKTNLPEMDKKKKDAPKYVYIWGIYYDMLFNPSVALNKATIVGFIKLDGKWRSVNIPKDDAEKALPATINTRESLLEAYAMYHEMIDHGVNPTEVGLVGI